MKKLTIFLIIAMFFTLGNSAIDKGLPGITLTASQVTTAVDIEHAIDLATQNGTRPGIVTLDAIDGDFIYSGLDRSINIYSSNVTLRSLNGAVLANCEDGVFFDDFQISNILIEGIKFICDEDGIDTISRPGKVSRVTIRNNIFETRAAGMSIWNMANWMIVGNEIRNSSEGIHLANSTGIQVINNKITGLVGIFLYQSARNTLVNNQIAAPYGGIQLSEGASQNHINGNKISQVESAGVLLLGGNQGNIITGNRVTCADGMSCTAVKVYDARLWETNKIAGNKLIR